MAQPVSVLCSMATRGLLAELAAAWDGQATVEATGGVDAARRVRDGKMADVAVLAGAAMGRLDAEGHLVPGSLVAVARSAMAVAVREADPVPDLSDADAVKRAVLAAGRTGFSTGPSGDHLLRLLEDWGIRAVLGGRLVQAPPGVPVGRLLSEGVVDLGFQQRSELMGVPGVTVAGTLPAPIGAETLFTAGILRTAGQPDAARGLIAFLSSGGTAMVKRRHGLEPA